MTALGLSCAWCRWDTDEALVFLGKVTLHGGKCLDLWRVGWVGKKPLLRKRREKLGGKA